MSQVFSCMRDQYLCFRSVGVRLMHNALRVDKYMVLLQAHNELFNQMKGGVKERKEIYFCI